MAEISNNKTIAKNTLLLYGRMLVTIVLGLYTSRIVLNTLGFSDYGIYNLVGGIVSMLSFLNVGMTQSSHRFIAYALGSGDKSSLNKVFSNSLLTHCAIAAIIFIVFESVGLWFVNTRLVIPDDRLLPANCVFQCSILTACLSITSVPYSACVVAHEKMGQFAYISILESILKFAVALGIAKSPLDRLCYYAIALLLVQSIVVLIYVVYCKRKFQESKSRISYNKAVFKEMLSFAGWGCVGNMGFSLKDQLSNILLNFFYGTVVNAARGIAGQVNGIINSFAMNFTMAMNPQITKSYASGSYEKYRDLTLVGTRVSFYLLSFVTIPFIINRHYVLTLWLGDIPEYTETMVSIVLLSSCIYAMSHTLSTAISATRHMKWFQILLSLILLMEIPISYTILYMGGGACLALTPCILTNFLTLVLRIVLINHYIPNFGYRAYCINTILKGLIVFIVAFYVSYKLKCYMDDSFLSLIFSIMESIISLGICIFIIGLSPRERKYIINKVMSFIFK